MTRDETVALFQECEAKRAQAIAMAMAEEKPDDEIGRIADEAAKGHWNAWADGLLAERKAMEAEGRWAAEKDVYGSLQPKNAETGAWIERAEASFSRCLFLVRGAEGTKETAEEEKKEGEDGELSVKSIQLDGNSADFSGYIFPCTASFQSATFSGTASFGSATFSGDARFQSATFSGDARFQSATFSGDARFQSATFSGDARFQSATFSGTASFGSATFSGNASFGSATFSGTASFGSATFSGTAWFESATFSGDAWFGSATFSGDAWFGSATFNKDAFFPKTRFSSPATFALCDFRRHATFEGANFAADASFAAIRGDRAFNMAGAVFEVVPDFIQAHFEEAPRLDNLKVGRKLPKLKEIEDEERAKLGRGGRWRRARLEKSDGWRRVLDAIGKESELRDIPARFRALKRLAIQGNDTERELEFHARELRSQRFVEDWPAPWRGKGAHVWKSVLGFWSGLAYGIFSNYGRSLLQPALFWLAGVALGAVCYVSQSPAMIDTRAAARAAGSYAIVATIRTAAEAWLVKTVPCHAGGAVPAKDADGNLPPYVGALSQSLQSGTDIANEAWHLAFRNAFIVLDGSSEAAHRTYGCLYGVELYGGSNPLAIVPSAVSTVSAIQKLFSALMIFLFGLALRNMLKMK